MMQCHVFVYIHSKYLRKHKNTTYRIEDSQCRHCRQDSQFSEISIQQKATQNDADVSVYVKNETENCI